jgi:lipoprotein-anchoring transpeptidase ErfK/SrfK
VRLTAPVAVALATAAAATAGLGGSAGTAAAAPPAEQPLVVLLDGHIARTRPAVTAREVAVVAARRPLTRVRTVLPVLARHGRAWVRVRLPGRPNGRSGWIRTGRTRQTTTPWRIALDLSSRRVTVFFAGRVERRFRAVIGAPATPTPRGWFFVEEAVKLDPREAGGPYALAVSARSEVLQEFAGGPGQIALHGTDGLSGRRGTAASHGCIRLGTRAITWLARRVGGGVPVVVTR